MPLYIGVSGVEIGLTPHLESDGSGITLVGKDEALEFVVPFPIAYPTKYSKENFEIHLLFKREVRENEIFQIVATDDKRLGWLFPLQSLESNKHKYAEDDNFLTFARIASELLCDGVEGVFQKRPQYEQGRDYRLSDFYSDQTVVLLLSKSHADVANGFDIEGSAPYFALHGCYLQTVRDPADGVVESIRVQTDGIRLKPRPTSPVLREEPFVTALISEVVPYEREPLSKFFFLYQLVELLLDKVLQENYKALANDLLEASESTSSTFKDLIENFSDKLSEKKRLNIMLSNFIRTRPDETDLRRLCNDFLRKVGVLALYAPDLINFSDYLYKVRNTLFHNFRIVDKAAQASLEPISSELKIILLELLLEFQLPEKAKPLVAAQATQANFIAAAHGDVALAAQQDTVQVDSGS